MTEQQKIHIAMLNSFKVLTGEATLDDILDSNVPLFSHNFEEDVEFREVQFIMKYFEQIEMFEKCFALSHYIEKTFDKNGFPLEKTCECAYPDIKVYEEKTKCSLCNIKLKR